MTATQTTATNTTAPDATQTGAISGDVGAAKGGRTVPASGVGNFRAFWPIIDDSVPMHHLIAHAIDDLPWLTSQAHAVIVGKGRWSIELSCMVPGSGRVTETILMFNAPAVEGRSPFADSRGEVA